ncbi:hypothetical protein ACHHRT_12280 [Desulfurivibrio sp. D14AmB]|uniref:hypothetical protein n=1 Tax=Desulfurivibrio sp. D14AmB TaxID=3374370 RepID=UPI00376EFA41
MIRRLMMVAGLKEVGKRGRLLLLLGLLLPLLIGVGCAAEVRSSLVEMELRLALPLLGRGESDATPLPVVYPAAPATLGEPEFPLEEFGPAWRGLEPVYSEYRFNPFNP